MSHFRLHTSLIGRLCKLTQIGLLLDYEYVKLYDMGNPRVAEMLYMYHQPGPYQVLLMFIEEKPFRKAGREWFWVKEIGVGSSGDWHAFTLDQLMICE